MLPLKLFSLSSDSDWYELARAWRPLSLPQVATTTLSRFRSLGALAAIEEEEYLDQDFSAEFSAFYSRVFKRHTKLCRRFHFFSCDLQLVFAKTNPEELSVELEKLGRTGHYLGYTVIRPVGHAPVGRTVIAPPASPPEMRSNVLVRSTFECHLLGASFAVTGMPLVQQDSRIGACAQAAIWMAGRHFHNKHRGRWFSSVEITEEASKPSDTTLSQSLPAGSSFLSVDNMVRALRAMDREPFAYVPDVDQSTSPATISWPHPINPAEVIHRYVDSGIPVILGLIPWEQGTPIGHAIVAVGHTIKKIDTTAPIPARPTRALYCDALLVNDDQRGSCLRMPIDPSGLSGETPYNVNQHVCVMLIPLPQKVYMPAEMAEQVAWDLIGKYSHNLSVMQGITAILGKSQELAEAFNQAINTGNIVARTYLTFGWKYRRRILRNCCSETLKRAVLSHDLPKYVWITEFGTVESLNHLQPRERKIFAHAVIDATSSFFWHSALIFHAPGLLTRWYHNPADNFGDYKFSMLPIADDCAYFPKVRGSDVAI